VDTSFRLGDWRVEPALNRLSGDEIWIGLNLASLRFRLCDERTKTERQ
jgi:hypothetical protein